MGNLVLLFVRKQEALDFVVDVLLLLADGRFLGSGLELVHQAIVRFPSQSHHL